MKSNLTFFAIFLLAVIAFSCKRKLKPGEVQETRTSGATTILVDETLSGILDDQIQVFKSDYPDTKFKIINGNENKILPELTTGKIRMMVLSRMLKPGEESFYKKRQIGVYTDRFAIDGIALIINSSAVDTNITVNEVYSILQGKSTRKLVFDNAQSSTIRYFIDSAKVSQLPQGGVYTLETNADVVKYVAENKGFIGVVGVNWLLKNNQDIVKYMPNIKTMAVKNVVGKKGSDNFHQPTQQNLINGKYPFLRNIYIINCEGRDGLGTGFANWLMSPRGQLIVLKSGLGPHKIMTREFNIKNTN